MTQLSCPLAAQVGHLTPGIGTIFTPKVVEGIDTWAAGAVDTELMPEVSQLDLQTIIVDFGGFVDGR